MGFKVSGLDEAEAWTASTLLEVGWHDVEIVEAEDGVSRNGHPQVRLRVSNADGDIQDWLVYTEATKGKFVQVLEAAGVPPGSGEWEFPTERLLGKKVRVKVGEEPDYNDPTRNRRRVQAYTGPDAAATATAPAKQDSDLPF